MAHLTYIGDSDFGSHINVGCGVVTVNYNGYRKFRSKVGDNAFIGCNTNLVSPVHVGADAYIAAGSTITSDVQSNELAIARALSGQQARLGGGLPPARAGKKAAEQRKIILYHTVGYLA